MGIFNNSAFRLEVNKDLDISDKDIEKCLRRLVHGDWGDMDLEEFKRCNKDLAHGRNVFALFNINGNYCRFVIKDEEDSTQITVISEEEFQEVKTDLDKTIEKLTESIPSSFEEFLKKFDPELLGLVGKAEGKGLNKDDLLKFVNRIVKKDKTGRERDKKDFNSFIDKINRMKDYN